MAPPYIPSFSENVQFSMVTMPADRYRAPPLPAWAGQDRGGTIDAGNEQASRWPAQLAIAHSILSASAGVP